MKTVSKEIIQKAFLNPLEYSKFLYSRGLRSSQNAISTIDKESEQRSELQARFGRIHTEAKSSSTNLSSSWRGIERTRHYPTINLKPRWSTPAGETPIETVRCD